MSNRVNHQEIVRKFLDAKSVDFKAIGSTVAELGPAAAIADEPWDVFCGTMRNFIRLFIINPVGPIADIEQLEKLRSIAGELER